MSTWMALDPMWSPEWALLRYATSLRATVLLALTLVATLLLRRGAPSTRAQLWVTVLVALLPLPWMRVAPLHWSAQVLPPALAHPVVSIGATMVAQSAPGALSFPWTSVLGSMWLVGVALVLGRLAWGWGALARLAARSRPVEDSAWTALLGDCARSLGVRRRVRLLRAAGTGTPLTWGTLRPAILLPADADGWPEAHRRVVLLHELTHIGRFDCLFQLWAEWTCALWWFHPGVWYAAHRLRVERERACDERVLRAGVRPSDYAECLLRIADGARGTSTAGPATLSAGLLRRSSLQLRLRAILDPAVRRRPATPRLAAITAAICTSVVLLFGSMRLGPRPDVLWKALRSPAWATRAYAAENIARFGDPTSVASLRHELRKERHPAVPQMARLGSLLRLRDQSVSVASFGWPVGS